MTKLLYHSRFWQGIVILVADTIFFSLTNPAQVGSSELMLGFLLLVATLYYLYDRFLVAVRVYGISFGRRPHRIALFATGVSAGLLALQSIGELSLRDILVLGPLALVLYVYLGYGRYKPVV